MVRETRRYIFNIPRNLFVSQLWVFLLSRPNQCENVAKLSIFSKNIWKTDGRIEQICFMILNFLQLNTDRFNKKAKFNMLTSNYEITHRLRSLPGCQTTSYLVLTYIEKSTCRFLPSFLIIAAAANVLTLSCRRFISCLSPSGGCYIYMTLLIIIVVENIFF